ncbi:cytochrome c biogenesis protein CcsA [Luteolibacter sp. AS25]|uniref:cytochrome c biogenesis protein CcsA n=1 Tax=Luteolibacter sp. AS25 TaxID=3135776 RepID=UPI00398A6FEC
MDRWFLIAATILAAIAGVRGLLVLRHDERSRWTVYWMGGVMLCQIGYLLLRGEMRGACPLRSIAEISVFLAWSLTLFYLLIGPVYRISLLGVFSAPLVFIFQGFALLPNQLVSDPIKVQNTTAWGETHSAMSVLAYGALALAAVAGVMFLVLDHLLKKHDLTGGLFNFLPPVRELLVSLERLLWLGMFLLSIGIIAGLLMPHEDDAWGHVYAALGVWLCYAVMMVVKRVRGITGRKFALGTVILFVLSLGVFAFV